MDTPDPADEHLRRLRQWRNRREADLSLHFMDKMFKRQVARPYQQVGRLVQLWEEHIPADLACKTALHSFQRGVLKVDVADSATLYQLNRLLRSGVEQMLREQLPAPLRSIKLQLGPPERFAPADQGD